MTNEEYEAGPTDARENLDRNDVAIPQLQEEVGLLRHNQVAVDQIIRNDRVVAAQRIDVDKVRRRPRHAPPSSAAGLVPRLEA